MTDENAKSDIFAGLEGMINGTVAPTSKQSSEGTIRLVKAPNAVAFIESPEYLNGPELFPVQYQIVRDFFELLCPHCNDGDRIRAKEDVPREDQILFEYDVCPKCGLRKKDVVDQLYLYNELTGVMGMRSGKGVLVACMSAAIIHELLCIENLQKRLGLVKKQEIEAAFVAASGTQASETVWGHFIGFYEGSPWFQELRKNLMDLELADPDLRRGNLYKEGERAGIYYKFKNIRLKPLHSNSASLAGKTRIFAVIDELSRFDMTDSKRSATEVYRVMKHSLLTIKASVSRLRQRGIHDIPDARMFCISSPIFSEDKMMQLLKQAQSQEKMFAFRRATWEANPDITKEDLADEYMSDPLGSERDYGANPPGAENPFIDDPNLIEVCIDKNRSSVFTFRERLFRQEVEGIIFNYITVEIMNVDFRNLVDYVICCDPGRANDSFALSMGHLDLDNGNVIIDGSLEVRPIPKGNREGKDPHKVHFPSMAEIIMKLKRVVSLKAVSFDRWQSLSDIDRLRADKILAVGANLDRDDHVKFAEAMRSRKISFPRREHELQDPRIHRNMPVAKALLELKMLNDDGKKVDHGSSGTNDIIQTWVAIHRLLKTPEKVINPKEMIKDRRRRLAGSRFNRRTGRVVHLKRYI